MIKRFIPKTIRGKITAVTACITFIITVFTVSVCFHVFQNFLIKNQIQAAEFSLQVAENHISTDMRNIIYFANWCGANTNVIHYLDSFKDEPKLSSSNKSSVLKPLALETYNRVKEEYYSTAANEYMSRVIISTLNNNNFLQIKATSYGSSSKDAQQVMNSSFFLDLYENPDLLWIGFVQPPFAYRERELAVPIVRPIYNQYNSKIIGWIYVEVDSQLFTDYLAPFPLAEDSFLFLSIGDKNYQLSDGQIAENSISYSLEGPVSQTSTLSDQTQVQSIRMEDGSLRTLVRYPISGLDGWYLSQVLSVQQFHQQNQIYTLLIIGICIAILSMGALLTALLNRIISRPLKQLSGKISAIANGDFSRDPQIEWDHELGQIGRGINSMAANIVALMDKRVADEKQKKDLEYQILQSQINPHFLYNTLNSIKWMATIQNATGIADMTTALARLLKSVSKNTASVVPLKAELDLVKDYFLIQQYRYGGGITLDFQIESEDLYDCEIHRFTLQPIIENALFHGIEPKGTAGDITVTVKSLDNQGKKDLEIRVTDNGVGMTPEMIRDILSNRQENSGKTDFFRHVGISNVNQRIRYDYGPRYGITIESCPGSFTTMIILQPYIIFGSTAMK